MRKGFERDLRRALNHLYDPDFLARSPLGALFDITNAYERPVKLQRILEEAIAALRPGTRDAGHARQWHTYELLAYRYLQQFSQREVADQLNVSLSKLARDQNAALHALALYLWSRYHLTEKVGQDAAPASPGDARSGPAGLVDDLAWLAVPSPDRAANAGQTLHDVVVMIQPLSARYQTALEVTVADNLPPLAVYPAALRQILLNLLTVALHSAPGGQVRASAAQDQWVVAFQVSATQKAPHRESADYDPAPSLEAARRMAELSGGRLAVETGRSTLTARLELPTLESTPILVIDDSADHLELLKRYTANTRYRLIGTQDCDLAVQMATRTAARAAIVDIMMPRSDGWTVLQRLRSDPTTASLPIVVCSIVPCEELALSLGASSFLHKPVSQDDFLAALAHWVDPEALTPR